MITIADIESFLWSIAYSNVSDKAYVGNSPLTIADTVKDYVVVSVSSQMRDFTDSGNGLLRKGNVLFELFAKDRKTGEPDSVKLSAMESSLYGAIQDADSDQYHIKYKSSYSSPRFDSGWHSKLIIYELTILK